MGKKTDVQLEHYFYFDASLMPHSGQCRICGNCIKFAPKSNSNLLTHLRKVHPDHLEIVSAVTEGRRPPPINDPSVNLTPLSKRKWYNSDSASPFNVSASSSFSVSISLNSNDALIEWLACDLVSPKSISSGAFRRFIETLKPEWPVPSYDEINLHVKSRAAEVRQRIEDCLAQAESIDLTVDKWKCGEKKGVLGITGHYIHDWQLKTFVILCKSFEDNSQMDVASHLSKILQHSTIQTVVMDCSVDVAHTVTIPHLNSHSEQTQAATTNGSSPDSNCNEENTKITNFPDREIQCFTYLLSLCLEDTLRQLPEEYKAQLQMAGTKFTELVSPTSQPVLGASAAIPSIPLINGAALWSQQLSQLKFILSMPQEDDGDGPHIDLSLLEEFISVLEPYETTMNMLLNQNVVTASLIIPCAEQLKTSLTQMTHCKPNSFASTLLDSLNIRLRPHLQYEANHFATILDPRFKATFSRDHIRPLIKYADDQKLEDKLDIKVQPHEANESPAPKKRFFTILPEQSKTFEFDASKAEGEMKQYLTGTLADEDASPLHFWRENQSNYPLLARVAQQYLACPATSTSVRRYFSSKGELLQPGQLSESEFEELVLIRSSVV